MFCTNTPKRATHKKRYTRDDASLIGRVVDYVAERRDWPKNLATSQMLKIAARASDASIRKTDKLINLWHKQGVISEPRDCRGRQKVWKVREHDAPPATGEERSRLQLAMEQFDWQKLDDVIGQTNATSEETMANDAGEGRRIDPERGTRFNFGRNFPDNLDRIFKYMQKEAKKHGYLDNRRVIRSIAMKVSPVECDNESVAEELAQFVIQQGIALEDPETGHCYPDFTRFFDIQQARCAGTPVNPPDPKEERLKVAKKTSRRGHQKHERQSGLIEDGITPPRDVTLADVTPPSDGEPESLPKEDILVNAPEAAEGKKPQKGVWVSTTTAVAAKTLPRVLQGLKDRYGWPDINRIPTRVMKCVYSALHPNEKNAATAASRWRTEGLVSNLGYVRHHVVMWQLEPLVCHNDLAEGRELSDCDISAVLELAFPDDAARDEAIADVNKSLELWPIDAAPTLSEEPEKQGGGEKEDDTDEPTPAKTNVPPPAPPTHAPEPAPEPVREPEPVSEIAASEEEDPDLAAIHRQIRELQERAKAIAAEKRAQKEREALLATAKQRAEELEREVEELRGKETAEKEEAGRLRELFKKHSREAERLGRLAEAKEKEAEDLRAQLRKPVAA